MSEDVFHAFGAREGEARCRWHVLPMNDSKDGLLWVHYASEFCPCCPLTSLVDGEWIWIHNAYDARERWERLGLPCDEGKGWANAGEIIPPPGWPV